MAYPVLSPTTAATIRITFSHQMFSAPAEATRPAVTSSESPGRQKPMRRPVSAKTMAKRTVYQLHGQEAEERGELDHRVHGHRGGVLEGVADGVADDGGRVQRAALFFQLGLDDLL